MFYLNGKFTVFLANYRNSCAIFFNKDTKNAGEMIKHRQH